MTLDQRIHAFARLGEHIGNLSQNQKEILYDLARQQNAWFTPENVALSIEGITQFLSLEKLTQWTSRYNLQNVASRKVGVAMAGNIPLVGFHDYLCILLAGHQLVAKLSSQDTVLIKAITQMLIAVEPSFADMIHFEERLNHVDAIIATGSDNTARYFEYYFRNIPNIIRKNRTSCAVIMGEEKKEELTLLGKDLFSYFGLGCRNVSKIYVPEGYNFTTLFESLEQYKDIIHHHKYANNNDYQKSIMLLNAVPFYDNGFLMITENTTLVSPISVLYYESYKDQQDLNSKLAVYADKIQCIVSANAWYPGSIPFGKAQLPEVWDYADNVDTLRFLEFNVVS